MGFKVSHLDPCVFIHHKNSNTTFISSHVDNLGLFCNSRKEIAAVKSKFLEHVKIKDLCEIKTILGIKVTHNCKKTYHITLSLTIYNQHGQKIQSN